MMNIFSSSLLGAGAISLALTATAFAEQSQQDFPKQESSQKSCQEVSWNQKMLDEHPHLIDACQEVVMVEGQNWARFHSKFNRVESNGNVVFSVENRQGRVVEDVVLVPAEGQVAHIDGRETAFRDLSNLETISLYAPEDQYGFATRAGGQQAAPVTVASRSSANRDPSTQTSSTAAAQTTRSTGASESASSSSGWLASTSTLTWLILGGVLLLVVGVVFMFSRRT